MELIDGFRRHFLQMEVHILVEPLWVQGVTFFIVKECWVVEPSDTSPFAQSKLPKTKKVCTFANWVLKARDDTFVQLLKNELL